MPLTRVHCRATGPESSSSITREQDWALLYQADTRARFEHWPRAKIKPSQDHQTALTAGKTTDYDEARPWSMALQEVASDERLWNQEFVEPAIIILADGKTATTPLGEDAKVAESWHKSQTSGAGGGGVAGNAAVGSLRLRSGEEHCRRELAVEVRWRTLPSYTCG